MGPEMALTLSYRIFFSHQTHKFRKTLNGFTVAFTSSQFFRSLINTAALPLGSFLMLNRG